MGSEIVIFGRSPFINKVDVPKLINKYESAGFNKFGRSFPVDYLFFFDDYFDGYLGNPEIFKPKHIEGKGNNIEYTRSDYPLFGNKLGHCYFTVSLAINYFIKHGYKLIYLVGIDHVESDTHFEHFDGVDHINNILPDSHAKLKHYIYNCLNYADIYQCNPDTDWLLPYKHIEELYEN